MAFADQEGEEKKGSPKRENYSQDTLAVGNEGLSGEFDRAVCRDNKQTDVEESFTKGRAKTWCMICNTEQYVSTFNERADSDIEKDVQRTFPELPEFQEFTSSGAKKLYNVLKAYSQYDLKVGYCQGMNYIAGMLLLYLQDEKLAYLCLLYIMFENNWRELYVSGMKRLLELIQHLTERIEAQLPAVHAHFKSYDIDMTGLFSHIFLTGFVYNTPLEFAVRVFDIFLLDREEALISYLVKILGLMQDKVLIHDSIEVYKYVKETMVRECIEKHGIDALLL